MRKNPLIQTMLDMKKIGRGHDASPLMMAQYYGTNLNNDDFYRIVSKLTDDVVVSDDSWRDDAELKLWLWGCGDYVIEYYLRKSTTIPTDIDYSVNIDGSVYDWTHSTLAGGDGYILGFAVIQNRPCPSGFIQIRWRVDNVDANSATIYADSYLLAIRLN
jgi:hypothetical protein